MSICHPNFTYIQRTLLTNNSKPAECLPPPKLLLTRYSNLCTVLLYGINLDLNGLLLLQRLLSLPPRYGKDCFQRHAYPACTQWLLQHSNRHCSFAALLLAFITQSLDYLEWKRKQSSPSPSRSWCRPTGEASTISLAATLAQTTVSRTIVRLRGIRKP